MGQSIKDGKLLYHLTALSNMESILTNGLQPRASLGNSFIDIAEQDIIDFRNAHKISNVIPFHFFAGTPFAGRVQIDHPEKEFVYLTLHRNTASSTKNNFKIFPTHPKHMNPLAVYDYKEGFSMIDWELMEKRDYSDPECKEVCMAECVGVYKRISSKSFHSIIVRTDDAKQHLEALCQKIYGNNCKPNFHIDVAAWRFVGK